MKRKQTNLQPQAKAAGATSSGKLKKAGLPIASKKQAAPQSASAAPQAAGNLRKAKPAETPVPTPARIVAQPAAPAPQILAELKALRALLQPSAPSAPTSADHVLESGVTSIRRLLSELLEQQTHWILARLVALRETAADAPRVAKQIDSLLDELGAVRFQAEALDYVDPLVHTVVEERPNPEMTEGLIVETVRAGYRTGVGAVLAKACVAVSCNS